MALKHKTLVNLIKIQTNKTLKQQHISKTVKGLAAHGSGEAVKAQPLPRTAGGEQIGTILGRGVGNI